MIKFKENEPLDIICDQNEFILNCDEFDFKLISSNPHQHCITFIDNHYYFLVDDVKIAKLHNLNKKPFYKVIAISEAGDILQFFTYFN